MADQVAQSSESGPQMEENVDKPRRPGFIVQFVVIVFTLVLMASGLVPLRDMLFAGFASVYFVLFAMYVYPCPTQPQPRTLFPNRRLLRRYVAFAGLISVPMAMAYILGSYIKGDQVAMNAATPHLFLIVCQVLSEIIVVSLLTSVSLPVRMMVPVFYNTRRLFSIATWLEIEFARTTDDRGWLFFGRGLAVVNMAVWAFNLFCFLLPVYLPLTMKKHAELERGSKDHQA